MLSDPQIRQAQNRADSLGLGWQDQEFLRAGWTPGKPKHAGTPCPHCSQKVKVGLRFPGGVNWFHAGCVRPWQALRREEYRQQKLTDRLNDLRRELAWRTPLATDRWGPMPPPMCTSLLPDAPLTWEEWLDEQHRHWWCIARLYAERVTDLQAAIAELEAAAV